MALANQELRLNWGGRGEEGGGRMGVCIAPQGEELSAVGTNTGEGLLVPTGHHWGRLPGGGDTELPPERQASQWQDSSPGAPPLPALASLNGPSPCPRKQ